MRNHKYFYPKALLLSVFFSFTVQIVNAADLRGRIAGLTWTATKELTINLVSDFIIETSGVGMTNQKIKYLENRVADLSEQLNYYKNESDFSKVNNVLKKIENFLSQVKKKQGDLSSMRNSLEIIKQIHFGAKLPNNSNSEKIGTKEFFTGVYVGELRNNRPHGFGVLYRYNGDTYEGTYENGKRRGCGVSKFHTNGYIENRCYTLGTRTYKHGVYTGELMNNQPHGKGVFIYDKTYNKYEGKFYRGERHGSGILYYNKGGREKKEYKNGKLVH